ncbi:MAG: CocE/NonD family hydrolase [Maribacter sp.]|nr:CocE/NonD family hydrolase [Maribacter sp.]
MYKTLIFAILSILFLLGCEREGNQLYDIEIKEAWITMSDGVQLAVDLYMPKTLDSGQKFPVLLEYLPYRKDEHRKLRYPVFSYFVQRGYVVARVDIRGTGRSEGKLIEYEYSEQEKDDGEEVIDWLSKQEFSKGPVGMFGISWGGFNSIHLALRQPPALKAILAMMATDDIYEDDVHFMDGMMHVDAYEIGRDIKNIIPGAPDYKINGSYFENKFDTEPWLLKYKRKQRDGEFWNKSSLNSDYSALKTPIFMISGWYDGYRDSTPKILENCDVPQKAIVGPWNHTFPHMADPAPSIEWRKEAIRWFDYWLKGIDNGIMKEPKMAAFIRDGHGPGVPDEIKGKWKWIDQWPPKDLDYRTYFLQKGSKLDTLNTDRDVEILEYKAAAGIEASGSVMWWGDWSPDLKKSDEHSLVYESGPLEKDISILGFPRMHFNGSVSAPQAHFISRLSDVSPTNAVTLVTGAGLNGSHRNSSLAPEPLEVDKTYPLDIEMHFTSWTFKKGHRIRVALSNGQWPMIWPNPSSLQFSLQLGGENASAIILPVIDNKNEVDAPKFELPFEDPTLKGYETTDYGTVSGFAEISDSKYDSKTGITQVIASNSGGTVYPWAKWSTKEHIVHEANDLKPALASVTSKYEIEIETKARTLTWLGILDFNSDKQNFYYSYTRKLLEGEDLIRSKTWNDTIPRDFQ